METLVLHLSAQSYRDLQVQAQRVGKTVDAFTQDLVEKGLQGEETPSLTRTARDILEGKNRLRPLSEHLKRRIIPGVTLKEVQKALKRAGEPLLSEIISEQRGSRA